MIAALGSIALDTTRTPMGAVIDVPGGSATYFSLSSTLFSKTCLISRVGRDFPQSFLDLLSAKGASLGAVEIAAGKTMRYHSTFNADYSQRTSDLTELNVLTDFNPVLTNGVRKSRFVYLGTLPPSTQLSVLGQFGDPKLVVMDTIEYFIKHSKQDLLKVLSKVNGIVINDHEAGLLAGGNIISCGKKILGYGADFCVIKKGEHGSILLHSDGSVTAFPAFPLEVVVDPTGAGDAFAGGFMGFLAKAGSSRKADLKKAMAWGTVMGAFAAESMATSLLEKMTLAQVESRYRIYRDAMHFESAASA